MSSSLITSVVTGGSSSHQTVAEELNNVATDFVTQGIVGGFTSGSPNTGAFAVTQDASPDMGVTVLAGRAYVAGTPAGQDAQMLNVRMTSNYTSYTINANSSGSTKFDWIYLLFSAANATNPSSAGDNVITLFTSRSTSNASDTGSPPTYGLVLAVVTVANGATSITNANIGDKRVQTAFNVGASSTNNGWINLPYPLTYASNNGNKEFSVTTPNNVTGILSSGMKLQITRSVSPPTQCMAFNSSSSQYATNSSPSGLSFTAAFTCEAWVNLNNFTGQVQTIVSRTDNSTGGFSFLINANGQITLAYQGSSNLTSFSTYQTIPLNTWVHLAGVIVSTSTQTAAVYINGTSAPLIINSSAASTLTQTGNLSVGATGAGISNTFFNGYISEVRVWSAAQSQANIQANMAINCVGNETNLVALYQGNGNFTDATSNANTLIATSGAVATNPSNPFNSIEYATVLTASYSLPTSTLVLDCGINNTIPNQTLNAPLYSLNAAPYGLPVSLKNYVNYLPISVNEVTSATSPTAMPGASVKITAPSSTSKVEISLASFEAAISGTSATIYIYKGATAGALTNQVSAFFVTAGTGGFTFVATDTLAVGPVWYTVAFATGNASDAFTISGNVNAPLVLKVKCDI